jgi:hypothetical protein
MKVMSSGLEVFFIVSVLPQSSCAPYVGPTIQTLGAAELIVACTS